LLKVGDTCSIFCAAATTIVESSAAAVRIREAGTNRTQNPAELRELDGNRLVTAIMNSAGQCDAEGERHSG